MSKARKLQTEYREINKAIEEKKDEIIDYINKALVKSETGYHLLKEHFGPHTYLLFSNVLNKISIGELSYDEEFDMDTPLESFRDKIIEELQTSISQQRDIIKFLRTLKGENEFEIHFLQGYDHKEIYDMTQTDDEIKHGDLIITNDCVAVLDQAWPVVIQGESKDFNTIKPECLEDFKHRFRHQYRRLEEIEKEKEKEK